MVLWHISTLASLNINFGLRHITNKHITNMKWKWDYFFPTVQTIPDDPAPGAAVLALHVDWLPVGFQPDPHRLLHNKLQRILHQVNKNVKSGKNVTIATLNQKRNIYRILWAGNIPGLLFEHGGAVLPAVHQERDLISPQQPRPKVKQNTQETVFKLFKGQSKIWDQKIN